MSSIAQWWLDATSGSSIQFDDEFLLDADEIGDVVVNRMLPAKCDAHLVL
jgi:hypothetical protein